MTATLGRCLAAAVVALALVAAEAEAQSFEIAAVDFGSSAYLDAERLDAIAGRYTGRPITFEDLQAMISEVQALYREAGVPTARAVLPPQEIDDGVLRVALVEAEIDSVEVAEIEETDPDFLRDQVGLEPGARPDFTRLERDLRLFEIAHDFAPRLSFEPGAEPGTTRAVITGDEPPAWEAVLSYDNFGREETGRHRLSGFARVRSLTGVRDDLTVQVTGSPVADGGTLPAASGSVGYTRPVGPQGGRIVLSAGYARSQILQGIFGPVEIASDTLTANAAYRLPFRVRPASHMEAQVGIGFENTVSTIEGREFADVTLYDLFGSWRYVLRGAVSRLDARIGLRAGQADALGTSETEGFFALAFGGLGYSQLVTDRIVVDVDASMQLAPDQNLPVARVFSAGGPSSLRGYPPDVRGGDSGATLSLQVSPSPGIGAGDLGIEAEPDSIIGGVSLRPFAFADAGLIVPFRRSFEIDTEQDLLAAAGVGLSARWRDRVSASVTVGVPLLDTLGFEDVGSPTIYGGLDFRL